MTGVELAGCVVLSAYVLWIFFLGVMNLARVHAAGQLGPIAYVLAMPLLVAAFTLDCLFNVTVGTVLFLEWPSVYRLTFSARLENSVHTSAGWRQRLAFWILYTLLQPFDTTGGHNAS